MISFETFKKIQDRLQNSARTPARKDLNLDFPLRGAVICGHCARPLTGCWAQGKYERYAYYCPQRDCKAYSKTIRREIIEGQFEALIQRLRPSAAQLR